MKRGFVLHHNGPPARCIGQPHSRCERYWAAVRDFHVNTKGWSDIAYSFGVCPHGTVFVGRGWHKNQFANGADVVGPDDGADRYWYTVLAFIGIGEAPTPVMIQGIRDLIAEGRMWGRCLDRVLPHNAFKVKPCPGPELTLYAKAWDNQPFHLSEEDDDMPTPQEIAAAVWSFPVKTTGSDTPATLVMRDVMHHARVAANAAGIAAAVRAELAEHAADLDLSETGELTKFIETACGRAITTLLLDDPALPDDKADTEGAPEP